MLHNWYSYATHCHVQGTSQSGKSKFSEHCIREHILAGNGACLIDWHGTLYQSLVRYLAYVQPNRPIVLLNPSDGEYVIPFNPFALPTGREPSSHVNRLASVLVKPWGAENTNELPNYEWIVKMVLAFMAATGEPLHHAAKLLEFPKKELREYAISRIEDDYTKQQWKQLQYVQSLTEWNRHVGSTQRRLGRFLSSRSIVRFTGLKRPGISIAECIRQKAILLINLKPSHLLDPDSARVFAALLLSEFLDAAIENMGDPQPYFLYLDECQNYLTTDAAQILDQVLKSGLRLTLLHHHLGQFHDNMPLKGSIDTNAKLKVVFAGLPLDEAKWMAEEFFLSEANERLCKEVRYRYRTEHVEMPYEVETESENGTSSSGFVGEVETGSWGRSSGRSVQRGTRFVPVEHKERDGQEDYGRDEKIAKLAARFASLKRGECYVKTPDDVYRYTVPWVEDYLLNPATFLQYKQSLHRNALTPTEADQLLKDEERKFLERSKEYESTGGRPKKKPAALHPQR